MPDIPAGPVYIYRATCQRVVDGDTFVAVVDLGFDACRTISVRLLGVNAPEHNRPGGAEAHDFLDQLLAGKALLLRSYRDRQSFARWVCDVWVGGVDVSAAIIAAGHGAPFNALHEQEAEDG